MTDKITVDEPYTEAGQQHESAILAMLLFLGSEIMLFGGLITLLLAYRITHTEQIVEASKRLFLWIGAVNTAVLLTSSLLAALAVHAARQARRGRTATLLAGASLLGCIFLALKGFEYRKEYLDGLLPHLSFPTDFSGPVEQLFMNIYLIATGLHALHLLIGVIVLLVVASRLAWGVLMLPGRTVVVEVSGLYWHLVDIIWIFLFPLLYLAR